MKIDTETTVGRLAAEHPLAARVLDRRRIDYCCGGRRSLAEACAARGADPSSVIGEIEAELARSDGGEPRWDDAPLEELIDHILAVYHRSLKQELPRLEAMARKVHQVHGEKQPELLSELLAVYLELHAELADHMMKEEQILFPMIQAGQGNMADGPIAVMEHEHDVAGRALERLRELTGDYTVPEGACNTWRALWHGLAALETELHRHIHLENNILFPRALQETAAPGNW